MRRAIIRERMSLVREKRQSDWQALAFTKSAVERHDLQRGRRTPHDVVGRGYGRASDSPDCARR